MVTKERLAQGMTVREYLDQMSMPFTVKHQMNEPARFIEARPA